MNPPRPSNTRPIDPVEVPVTHVVTPVILGDVRPISQLPRLVLHLGRVRVQRPVREGLVLDVRPPAREGPVVEPPQRPDDLQVRQRLVDDVLVRALQVLEDDPVQVRVGGGEGDVDVVCALGDYRGVGPLEVVLAVFEAPSARVSVHGQRSGSAHLSLRSAQLRRRLGRGPAGCWRTALSRSTSPR